MRYFTFSFFIFLSVNLLAAEQWTFTSNYDRFTLTKQGANFFYDGQKVQGNWAEHLRPVLENEMNVQCEGLPQKPDLRLKWDRNGRTIQRNFYLKAKVASDGTNCLDLTGQGIYYAPFHRAWFVGDQNLSLNLSQGFEIGSEVEDWAKFKRENGRLVPDDPTFTANWETVSNLQNILKQFPVEGRAHPEIFDDPERNLTARNVILKTQGKTFQFRQVKGGTWLMQMPNIPWLVLSSKFGIFDDMTASSWKSPHSDQLKVVKDSEAEVEQRIGMVRSLKSKSSPDVLGAFHDVLLKQDENEKLKSEIVGVLRYYPSNQNMAVLTMALEKTQSPELIMEIIKVLKLRNPKGPQIDLNDDWEEVEKVITNWRKWAQPFEKDIQK